MGMLDGEIVGEVMAIKFAEIGAQGEERTFTIVSKDEKGQVSTCRGSYGYVYETLIVEGDVRNADLEKALPIIKETGVAQPMSMVRGHFRSKDGKWFHIDLGSGNDFFVRDLIAKELLARFAGQRKEDMYLLGLDAVKEILGGNANGTN